MIDNKGLDTADGIKRFSAARQLRRVEKPFSQALEVSGARIGRREWCEGGEAAETAGHEQVLRLPNIPQLPL
jgi:hypothetical protein